MRNNPESTTHLFAIYNKILFMSMKIVNPCSNQNCHIFIGNPSFFYHFDKRRHQDRIRGGSRNVVDNDYKLLGHAVY